MGKGPWVSFNNNGGSGYTNKRASGTAWKRSRSGSKPQEHELKEVFGFPVCIKVTLGNKIKERFTWKKLFGNYTEYTSPSSTLPKYSLPKFYSKSWKFKYPGYDGDDFTHDFSMLRLYNGANPICIQ